MNMSVMAGARLDPKSCPVSGVRFIPFRDKRHVADYITRYGMEAPKRNATGGFDIPTRAQQDQLLDTDTDIELRCSEGRLVFRRGGERIVLDRNGSVYLRYQF